MRLFSLGTLAVLTMFVTVACSAADAIECHNITLDRGEILGPVLIHASQDPMFVYYQRPGEKLIFRIDKTLVKEITKTDCAKRLGSSAKSQDEQACFNIVLGRGDVFRRVNLLPSEESNFLFYKRVGEQTTYRIDKSLIKLVERVDCPKSWDSSSAQITENQCYNLKLANGHSISNEHYKKEELFGQMYIVYWREGAKAVNRLSASHVVGIEQVKCPKTE